MESQPKVWTPERVKVATLECQEWLGTPHRDRMAEKKKGVDCINFVHRVLVSTGILPPATFTGYTLDDGMFDFSDKLERVFKHVCYVEAVPREAAQFGDIAVFRTGGVSGHCGFVVVPELYHSLAGRRVTASPLALWEKRIKTLFRITREGYRNHPQTAVNL